MNLLEEIGAHTENRTLIFAETKRKVDSLTHTLRAAGYVKRF